LAQVIYEVISLPEITGAVLQRIVDIRAAVYET
jgi:hypothetical protein